jgi:hypothetical protein
MGNCASLTDNLITGGVMAGALVAGVATGGVGTALAAGVIGSEVLSETTGHGVSPFDIGKHNCGHVEKSAVINAFHQIVSYSIFKHIQNCSNQTTSKQLLSIGCHPDTTTIYEENPICRACYEENFQGMLYHHKLQRELLQQHSGAILLPITKEYETLLYRLTLCGIRHCKACVLTNTVQSSILGSNDDAISVDCLSQVTDTQQFTQNLSATLNQVLTQNTDVLNAVAQAMGGNQPVTQITQDIVNRSTQVIDKAFLSQVVSNIRNNQVITLRMSDGYISGLTQESVYNSISKQVSDSSIATQIVGETLLDSITDILQKQTTISPIGEMVYKPIEITIGTMSVAAKYILYGGLAVICLITLIILAWLLAKLREKQIQVEATLPMNDEKKRK